VPLTEYVPLPTIYPDDRNRCNLWNSAFSFNIRWLTKSKNSVILSVMLIHHCQDILELTTFWFHQLKLIPVSSLVWGQCPKYVSVQKHTLSETFRLIEHSIYIQVPNIFILQFTQTYQDLWKREMMLHYSMLVFVADYRKIRSDLHTNSNLRAWSTHNLWAIRMDGMIILKQTLTNVGEGVD
jgi:hypothetical protein